MAKKYMQRRTAFDADRDEASFFKVHDKMIENIKPAEFSNPPWGIIKAKKRQKEIEEEYYREQIDEINNMFK